MKEQTREGIVWLGTFISIYLQLLIISAFYFLFCERELFFLQTPLFWWTAIVGSPLWLLMTLYSTCVSSRLNISRWVKITLVTVNLLGALIAISIGVAGVFPK